MSYKIYRIDNLTSGLSYIGCTQNLEKRLREHRHERPEVLEGEIEVTVLEECESRDRAGKLEDYYIQKHKTMIGLNGYNKQTGGFSGYRPSESTKQKMSLARLGKKHSPETRAKMSSWQIGKKLSEETKEKIRQARLKNPTRIDPRKRKDFQAHMELMSSKRRGVPPWCKGKKMSADFCRKVSVARKNDPRLMEKIQKMNEARKKKASTLHNPY